MFVLESTVIDRNHKTIIFAYERNKDETILMNCVWEFNMFFVLRTIRLLNYCIGNEILYIFYVSNFENVYSELS